MLCVGIKYLCVKTVCFPDIILFDLQYLEKQYQDKAGEEFVCDEEVTEFLFPCDSVQFDINKHQFSRDAEIETISVSKILKVNCIRRC